jgi:hypothetical protein
MWENRNDDFPVNHEFVFKYLTSIEHHHPQNDTRTDARWKVEDKDDIGNLFLVYSSENSSMSNSTPSEKKNQYLNAHNQVLPDCPKRRWMYDNTTPERNWVLEDMRKLSGHARKLLDEFLTGCASSNAITNSRVDSVVSTR